VEHSKVGSYAFRVTAGVEQSNVVTFAKKLAYREDSPENRAFNRSCHVGGGRGGDFVQSKAG